MAGLGDVAETCVDRELRGGFLRLGDDLTPVDDEFVTERRAGRIVGGDESRVRSTKSSKLSCSPSGQGASDVSDL